MTGRMGIMGRCASTLAAALALTACSAGASPDAVFDRLRDAAQTANFGAIRELLTEAGKARFDAGMPDWSKRGEARDRLLAEHGGELLVLVRSYVSGWTRKGEDRVVLSVKGLDGGERTIELVREGSGWRFRDLSDLLALDPARRECLERFGRVAEAIRKARPADDGETGTAWLLRAAAGLPEADRLALASCRGPDREVLSRVASGEQGVVVACDGNGPDGRTPAHPDGVCVLYGEGRAEFLPWALFEGYAGGPVTIGPGSPDGRVVHLVLKE